MRPADHPPIPPPRVGVLLVNLGTPQAPTAPAVRRYLAEFLSDKRVVELPSFLWQPVLRGVVLQTRPRRSAAAYAEVWRPEGSPLAVFTARAAAALQARLGTGVMVDHAMRYGEPAMAARITAMKDAGCERILLAPLYPQYSGATMAAAHDAAFAAIAAMRWQPALRTLPAYHDDAAYIAALAETIAAAPPVDALVASFHGMPARTLALGDPYHCQCQKTARLLSEALGREVIVSFQSRFGRAKWLEPATDAVLAGLPGKGVKSVAVVCPGFAMDCLETLEEVAMEGRQSFLDAGGEAFHYVPCLNDGAPGMAMLETIVRRELAGWFEPS